jgi:ribosomal protein S18 acetylase RimI-like enzyme
MGAWMWRSMQARDLGQVVALADRLFPDHPEAVSCFAERLALGADLCLSLSDEEHNIVGYAMAYPWPLGCIPPLNEPLAPVPVAEGSAYLHDLGIDPEFSGCGYARAGLATLVARACRAGVHCLALVAVNRSAAFWQRQGFRIHELDPVMATKLATYGAEAHYMIWSL